VSARRYVFDDVINYNVLDTDDIVDFRQTTFIYSGNLFRNKSMQ